MTTGDSTSDWEQRRTVLPFYLTVQGTILLTTLLQLPTTTWIHSGVDGYPVDGWIALWFVLEIFGVSVAVSCGIFSRWRIIPQRQREILVLGYLAGAWIGLLSLTAHFLLSPAMIYFTAATGLLWMLAFALLRRRTPKAEELFP